MILDPSRPYRPLGPDRKNPDYMLQDGIIFGWSESNIRYESAWWLTPQGQPINDSDHVRNLLRDRPFKQEWL